MSNHLALHAFRIVLWIFDPWYGVAAPTGAVELLAKLSTRVRRYCASPGMEVLSRLHLLTMERCLDVLVTRPAI